MSNRIFSCTVVLLCFLLTAKAQTRLDQTLQSYTEAQKRLLAKNMGRFLYMVFQGQWDQDSATLYACKIYGFNRQFPYDEMIRDGGIQKEIALLGEHHSAEVAAIAERATGEKRVRLLLELAIYYLRQPGSNPAHLNAAGTFIAAARNTQPDDAGTKKWKIECDALEGELLFQRGDQPGSVRHFSAVANSFRRQKAGKRKAKAMHDLGLHLPFTDSNRVHYLEKAFAEYQQLGLKEHAIEVLSDIATFYFVTDWKMAKIKLDEVLALQRAIGYRHVMETLYVISFMKGVAGDHFGGIAYADSTTAIMTQTGDSILYSLNCTRLADMYASFEDTERAFRYYNEALIRKDIEPQPFWYRSFLYLPILMDGHFKPNQTLAWINGIVARYPPQGLIDSLNLNMNLGVLYDSLAQRGKADYYYQKAIDGMERVPVEHAHGTLVNFRFLIGRVYYFRKQYIRSRASFQKAVQGLTKKDFSFTSRMSYLFLSKLDSIDGNFRGALVNYQKYKANYDSSVNVRQRVRSQELNVQYETAKMDQNIKLLRQEAELKESNLQRAELTRNIILAGFGLLIVIAILLYNQYRAKKKSSELIAQKNKALEQLVDEKQWLLKEVHHRVKNSLQTVVSLLELQTDYLRNDPMAAIQSSQNRIFATSLLHQKLYQADNMSSVNMNIYLPELVHYLEEAFQTRSRIHFHTDIESIELDISQAVPIGIIINEVITNAIKHAFPDPAANNDIHISLSMEADAAILRISDNGKGLPAQENEDGLGMKLVRGLTEDIDGAIQIFSDAGTTVLIRFKPRPALNTRRFTQQEQSKQQHEETTYR